MVQTGLGRQTPCQPGYCGTALDLILKAMEAVIITKPWLGVGYPHLHYKTQMCPQSVTFPLQLMST